MQEKVCPRCNASKPVDAFGKNKAGRDGLTTYCRQCTRAYAAAWHAENPDRHAIYLLRSRAKGRKYGRAPGWEERDRRRAERIAIGDAEWKRRKSRQLHERRKASVALRRAAFLDTQGGVCAICRAADPGDPHGWHLDHDHACCTAPVKRSCGQCDRGALCMYCNVCLVPTLERLNVDQQSLLLTHSHLSDPETLAGLEYLREYRLRRRVKVHLRPFSELPPLDPSHGEGLD